MTTSKLGLGLCILSVLVSATIIAEANGPMVSGQLEIQGTRLTIYDDGTANDADQVLDVGQQARVRTCYGSASGGCGTPHPSDPSIAGLAVLGELRGPELPQAIPLRTYPGGAFEIPGFQQEGDYFLENIRLVNDSTGNALGSAEPSVALLRVRQIALASATVTTLSLEDLAARGIAISQENFQAFNFAVGFYFGEEFVSIDLPVIYQGNGEIDPLGRPTVNLDGLPPEVVHTVSRWQPPSIVPFTLEIPEQDLIEYSEEPYEPITFPVFGAIVLPGNVSFLNQFFDARLIIANGAPLGSGVDLANLTATIQLPGGNVLRLARTEPPVSPGQSVPLLTETGDHVVPPDEAATATWTIEGLATGTHVLRMDASGEIIRPGRPTVPVETSAQAAVEVVDARFHLTFSHPDVVREGTEYSLFVTVANLSQATQNLISVEIDEQHITGAHKSDPGDDFIRSIEMLAPGQSETVEYRLIADVTGKVLGGSFEADSSSGGGSIQLYTGVGELGIPLSPATLRLPRFSERLAPPFTPDDEYYLAAMRFLGLAYSLAVAPAGMAPQGLPHVIRTDVEARAIDMGFAGQRTFLDERMLETLEVLLLDWLGNREPLVEIDELRRSTEKGLLVADQLATLLRHEQGQRDLSAVGLFDHFAETTSYARKFVSVLLVPGFSAEPPDLEILRFIDGDWTRLAGYAGDPEGFRTVPFGDVIPVSEIAGGTELVPLAVVGHVESGDVFEVFLRNHTENEKAGRLVLVVPDGDTGEYRRLDYGTVVVPAHSVYAVTVGAGVSDPSAGGFVMVNTTTTGPVPGVSATLTRVPLPPFKLIGARQDYGIGGSDNTNRYGQGLSYLFSRPPDETTGTEASNYRIQSDFDGFDVRGDSVSRVSEKVGLQAFLQPSERVVNVRYSSPLSALVDPGSGEPLVAHQHLIDPTTILDTWGNELDASIPEPQIETDPMHEGGLVGGRVLRGTGEPAADAVVKLLKPRLVDTAAGFGTVLDLVSEVTTGADGAFYFDFVETTHLDRYVQPQFFLRATVPEGNDPATQPAGVEEVSSTIRQQNRLANINIAMLGRGTVTGRLIYLDTGDPVPEGRVTVSSTLFSDSKTETVEPDGSFEVSAMPVGPLTLTGRDSEGRAVYATVGLERPGDVVDVVLELPRTQPPGLGTIIGTVYRQASGDPLPPAEHASGAAVEVYSAGASLGRVETDGFGRFRFADVPEGQVTVQAADFRVSRTSVVTNVMLSADETVEVSLTIPESDTRSVSGTVYFFDPVTNSHLPVVNQPAFINGPGVFAYTDELGQYVIEGVPVQAAGAGQYQVSAIDYERKLQGATLLPPIDDVSPDVVLAQDIVLREMRGGLRGIVLDPLGRPIGGAKVVAALSGVPYFEAPTAGDGSFSFDDLSLGEWTVTAHFGDGLQPDRIGYFGTADTEIVFGGHTPFVSIQLVGSGVVNVQVKTDGGSGIQSEVFYRPTYFSESARSTVLKGSAIEAQTDPNGLLQLELPVGRYEITAYSPFHGVRSVSGSVEWPGQVKTVDLVFGTASTVTGALVNVDGVTPIPDFPVVLETATLLPQTQITDAQGRFRFELVPEGGIQVTSSGQVGSVDRVAIATGRISGGGETLDLTVAMKAQGSVEGQVFDRVGDDLVPIPYAQYYVRESSYPNRRLPQGNGWYSADSDGRYQVAHVYAGGVTVVARDPAQTARQGSARGAISSDWQVVALPDIVMSTSVGRVEVTIRDPESGGALPDTQVTLRQQGTFSEMTVADSDGLAIYDALPLGAYSVYAFHAPTGRSGVLHYLALNEAGQVFTADLWVDQPGEVAGTLYDDPAKLFPIPGATVRLRGATAGGFLTALDTTSGQTETLGEFSFLGIPEGSFDLSAGISGSNRRASGQVAVTATAPTGLTDLVLEPVGDVVVRAFESLSSGIAEVDTSTVLLSARLQQDASYDYSLLQPTQGNPGHWYEFPDVLLERSGNISIQELGGEQRKATMSAANFVGGVPLPGSGTTVDPYQIILGPKGAVRVTVLDAGSLPVSGANVTLVSSGGGTFPSVTNAAGQVTFTAVPAGNLTASATAPLTGFGGRSTSTLVFDDDVIEMVVNLAPAVAAHGVIYQPVPGDLYSGDPSTLVPQSDAIVAITDSLNDQQMIVTGADGAYRFDVLPTGAYTVSAQSFNGESIGAVSGTLVGPDGNDNQIPPIILDGGPPQIVSITPPPGMHDVSRTAAVEIVFSEPLSPAVLPTGQPTSPYFELRGPSGLATGTWGWAYDSEGRPVVSFVPSTPYDNTAVYSITVSGGPGGVRDLSDRPLTPSGNVGSNFTTSDSIGPKVLATEPTLLRPVDPDGDLRFDFNEGLVATADQLNGDGVDDAASFFWGQDDGAGGVSWQPFPVTLFLTRINYSLNVDPIDGLVLTDDTLARRVVIEDLEDSQGNVMQPYDAEFRVWDGTAPVIDSLPYPDGAPTGDLLPGTEYVLTPVLSGVDHLPYDPPEGDVDRVDYFFSDPTAPGGPTQPDVSTSNSPFSFSFIASYSGNGVDPRQFPVWARAVDTSTNESNTVLVELEIQPNQAPTIVSVDSIAVSPVPGTPYAGSTLHATVSGLADPDGSQLALRLELWQVGGALIDGPISQSLLRPAGGWAELTPPVIEMHVPLDEPEGTELMVRAIATDAQGASVIFDGPAFLVADDQGLPVIESIVVRDADDGQPKSLFYIGDELYVELTVRDPETTVLGAEIAFDRSDIFASPQPANRVSGNLYRTTILSVPPDLFSDTTPVELTVTADDRGGNTGTATYTFDVAPEPDPTAPTVEWSTPWEAGQWPANYTSTVSPGVGTALLLRAQARDLSDDGSGGTIPGNIVSVTFAGPVDDGAGGVELSATPIPGNPITDTVAPGEAVYEAVWLVPDGIAEGEEIPFSVRVVDSGGLDVTSTVRMQARAYRRVYESSLTPVLDDDPMLEPTGVEVGAVFILDGAVLSLYPQSDGSVRFLDSVYLYAGGEDDGGSISVHGTRLTAPEVNSFGSPILFYPLELQIEDTLAVGDGAAIDVSRRGLLGSTGDDAMVLPGETRAGGRAGGSHGGSGWFGVAGSWNDSTRYQPSSTFDSVRAPHLPGAGGGGWGTTPGGNGGGVIRILGDEATVLLVGDVLADGGDSAVGGGAGGAIELIADRLEGNGRVSARGGDSTDSDRSGGGGGGRIAITTRELGGGADPVAQSDVSGGGNGGTFLGGAGTIYIDTIDQVGGDPSGVGEIHIINGGGVPAGPTLLPALGEGVVALVDSVERTVSVDSTTVRGEFVGENLIIEDESLNVIGDYPVLSQVSTAGGVELEVDATATELAVLQTLMATQTLIIHSRARYTSVSLDGDVRVVFDGDVSIGPAGDVDPSINVRDAITGLSESARAILRGEDLSITISATPEPGADLLIGSTVSLSWIANDPLGLASIDESWPLTGYTRSWLLNNQPTSWTADPNPLVLLVPEGAPTGSTTYTLLVEDIIGRTATRELSWNVLPGHSMTGSLSFAEGAPATVQAGFSTTVQVYAENDEGLRTVTLFATGPVVTPMYSVAVNGNAVDVPFTVEVLDDADGTTPIVLHATITDLYDISMTTNTLQVEVTPDLNVPVVSFELDPIVPDDIYTSGDAVTIWTRGLDDVGVHSVSVTLDDQTTTNQGGLAYLGWVAPAVEQTTVFPMVGEATDPSGNVGSATQMLTVEPLSDSEPPVVSILCPIDGSLVAPGSPIGIDVEITDDIKIGEVALFVNGSPVDEPLNANTDRFEGTFNWTPPADTVPGDTFSITVEAHDFGFNAGSQSIVVTTTGGTVLLGDQDLTSSYDGEDLVLAYGSFTATVDLTPDSLTLLDGATLTSQDLQQMAISIPGAVNLLCGSSIDVTGRGYPGGETYPGFGRGSDSTCAGSHLGEGGCYSGTSGETFGSVTRPQENGAGSWGDSYYGRGGGVVRIEAQSLDLQDNAAIRANGIENQYGSGAGAGGSIWITADAITGSGVIEASGGVAEYGGAAGGGAISLEFGSLDPAMESRLRSIGGRDQSWDGSYGFSARRGAAGTVFLFQDGESEFGDLVVDAAYQSSFNSSDRWTLLPSLGSGTALEGSSGRNLETDLIGEIPSFFVGHWVEVRDSGGVSKGIWWIESITDTTITLEDGATVHPGDSWYGIYRFDSLHVTGYARVRIDDLDEIGTVTVDPDSTLVRPNPGPPLIDIDSIEFGYDGTSKRVTGAIGAVLDENQPVRVTVTNTATGGQNQSTAGADGSFNLPIVGTCGDHMTLTAEDSHLEDPLQATVDLGGMPDVIPPVLEEGYSHVYIRAFDRAFWASGSSGAITDDCTLDSAYLSDPAQPAVQSPVTVEANGSFAWSQVPSTTVGVVPQLTVIDGGGNSSTIDLDPLPANTGPPTIRTSHITTSTSDGSYIINSRGECDFEGDCMAALESPDDWIFAARLENRTTPGFGDWELTLREVVDGGTGGGVGYNYFDPQTVTGAIGDEIWLVAEDGHPQWQSSEARVWTLPGISGAPVFNLGSVNLVYFGGQYRVSGESGAVTDADAPISLEAIVWRDVAGEWTEVTRESGTIASGDAFDLVLSAGAEGDLVVLSATDSTGRGNAWRIGTLPPAVAITVNLGSGAVSVSESAGSITIPVTLSEAPPIPVSVDYRTIPGTAEADVDYTSVAGTIAFGPTTTSDEIEIPITGDSEIETDEIFQVVIEDLVGIEPGTTMISDVTIFDDDGEAKTVTYSVGVDDANMLTQPIGLSISNGVATFSQPLPVGPDRGDEVLLDNGTRLFISAWIDDSHFDLVQPDGLPASDLTSGSAVSITPAFSSLEAAVDGASDADHLGTFDLVIANRNLEILCYRGTSDNTPVTIDGWITSPDHRIRIEAPSPHGQRNGTQRHTGRWDDSAYRLQPWATDCLTSTVGNITIEGLQIYGAGYQQSHIHAIRFDGVDGDVEVLETLIFFDNQVDGEDRVGISMTASEPANLTVRNSAIWDMGDGAVADQVGILTDDALVTANIENTTIIGGAYGIRSGAGSVTSINNLVAGAATACYDGSFTAESAANLATDSTAPGEAPIGISPVSVMGSTTGRWADLHLGCLVSEQGVTITSSPGDWPDSAFDGNPETVFISDAVNPASLRLVFDQPRTLSGTAVEVSNSSTHDWMVAAADTVADLDAQTGSYRVLVPWRALDNLERAYEHIAFEQPETTSVLELNVQRLGGGDYVHINEWWIDGVNSACGQGVPLDGTSNGFDIDVDSLIRTGPWDVGADQHSDLSIFYWWSPRDWWESEGEAKVQVLLSEPVDTTVTARYRTEDGGGIAGVDYVHVEGELVFDPGEVSKIVTIPIIDDGPGDNGEEVFLRFEHAVGARILNDRWSFRSRDDSPPPDRVRLITPFISVSESDGETVIEAEVDTAPTSDLVFAVSTIDGSAHIVADFAQPWVNLVIPAGQLTGAHSLTIVDDDIAEPDEIFYLRGSWSPYEFGAPVYGVVRIIDDDLPSLVFTQAGIDVEETAGSVDLTVEVIGEIVNPIAVDVVSGVGTATIGEDFQFTPTQLQFDPIHRSRTVSIPILENAEYEPDETIVLELTGASGATVGSPASAVITILAQNPPPEPAVAFSNTDYSFIESDDPFDFNININPPLPDGSATVDVVVLGGTATRDYDFYFSDQRVTIVSEETEAWLRVWGYADSDYEGDETIILQLTNPQGIDIGSPSTATITIIDDEVPPTVAFSSDTYSIIEFEDEFEVSLLVDPPPEGAATVDVVVVGGTAVQGVDFEVGEPWPSAFGPTETTQWLNYWTIDDSEDEDDETIILQLTNAQGVAIGNPSTATLTIRDDDSDGPAAEFESSWAVYSEGDGIVGLWVDVSPPPTGPASVDVVLIDSYGAGPGDYTYSTQTLNFDPGSTSASALLDLIDDSELEYQESLTFELQNPQGIELRYPFRLDVSIEDNDSAAIDPGLLSIDVSGCTPTLVAGPNAVTAAVIGINVNVQVRDRNFGSTWNAPQLEIEGGEAFQIELPTLDLGGRIRVSARAVAGGATDYEYIYPGDFPPTINPGWTDFSVSPIDLTLDIDDIAAITDRLADVRLSLLNTTAVTEVPMDDPCETANPSATIAAALTDEIQLRACQGVLLELCTSVVIREGGGP